MIGFTEEGIAARELTLPITMKRRTKWSTSDLAAPATR
jgi:hypothetical protein